MKLNPNRPADNGVPEPAPLKCEATPLGLEHNERRIFKSKPISRRGKAAVKALRASAGPGMSTNEIMTLTRGEEN